LVPVVGLDAGVELDKHKGLGDLDLLDTGKGKNKQMT
jgi:hypothetical protein